MLEIADIPIENDSDEWAERSDYWIAECAKTARKRKVREREKKPLILTGHGSSLRIEKGTMLIRQGYSHYPQSQEQFRFFKGDLQLPRLILLLDGSGSLSFEVLNWLGEQGVSLARIQWDSDPAVFASTAGFTGDPDRLRWQYELRDSETKRLEFARDLIQRKIQNSLIPLKRHIPPSQKRDIAIAKANEAIALLNKIKLAEMDDLRAIEGECAARYFAAWSAIELQWKSESRFPIPDSWRRYRSRSSILTGKKARNWKASHPLNAMLNYAFAVKVSQLQIEAVANGYDPFAGIMHHTRTGFPAYAYDLIEPERPLIEAKVLHFALKQKFSGADFILRKDGVCRLSPQLARMVAKVAIG